MCLLFEIERNFIRNASHANTKTNTYELCSAKQCRVILPSPPRDKLSHYHTRKRNLFFLFLSFPKWWVFGNVGSPNSSLSIALNYVNLIISCKRTKTLFIIYWEFSLISWRGILVTRFRGFAFRLRGLRSVESCEAMWVTVMAASVSTKCF